MITKISSILIAGGIVVAAGSFAVTYATSSSAPPAVSSSTQAVDAFRAYDSRLGGAGKLVAGSSVTLDVLSDSAGTAKLPDGATAVFFTLTAVDADGQGFLAVSAGDATVFPTTSTVNYAPGQVTSNTSLVRVPVSGEHAGTVAVSCGGQGRTHFILDIVGYTT